MTTNDWALAIDRAPNGLVYRPAAQQRMSHVFGVDIFITYPSMFSTKVGVGDRRRRGKSRSIVVNASEREGRKDVWK